MRLVDATPLECQAKERKENEWNQRVSPTSWAHAEESFLHRIEDAPTVDAVVVTRCKDCKHKGWVQEPCHGKSVDYCKVWDCTLRNLETTFCSYGKRKDGGAE
jgi:hypothetical protein